MTTTPKPQPPKAPLTVEKPKAKRTPRPHLTQRISLPESFVKGLR